MKILLLDDDELSVEMMETLLDLNGCDVKTCTEPKLAVELIKKEHYDLILTDFMMPGMNGIVFIETIKDYIQNSKIAFTTAYMKDLFGSSDKASIVDRIFMKPINIDELLEYVDSLKNNLK